MAAIAVAAIVGAVSLYSAKQQEKAKKREGTGYLAAAGRARIASQREAIGEARKAEYANSRALAVAAASGGGIRDPGMVKLLADLAAEGEYRVMSRLYAGETEAEGLDYRAEAAKREGKALRNAGYLNSVTSALSTYKAWA